MELNRRHLLTASALLLARPSMGLPREVDSAGAKPLILCWNENPYGPSPKARAVIAATISESCRYPDEDIRELTTLLARENGIPADHLVLGTGSGELLRAMGALCARDRGEIVAAQPTYTELTEYAHRAGATLKFVPVDKDLRHDLDAMRAAVSERTRVVYLCNPNNPTGTALPSEAIDAFVAAMPQHVTVVIDEAYMDFVDLPGVRSALPLVTQGRRVVVLRTFSKIHGMAGIRVGYGIAGPDLITELTGIVMTSPNIFAMRAARASLLDPDFRAQCFKKIRASRTRITTELARLGRRYAVPQGNFVFFDTGMPLEAFSDSMKARNILVGRLFPPYDTWCRITIGTEPEVATFLQALNEVLKSGITRTSADRAGNRNAARDRYPV
ncbi:MAG TPA: histidinol-phosphate transaminase [Steroidobacteraceae bacterium]|nr:histidinol-phosphate transaminase [Steroidobacteraceae bacterium]